MPWPATPRCTCHGGPRFGRAFKNSLINADRGYAVLIEPAWRPLNGGAFAKSEIYAFADYGQADVFSRVTGAATTLDIGSYGGGVRAAFKDKGVLEVEIAHPYEQPVPDFYQDWRLSVGWRIEWRP